MTPIEHEAFIRLLKLLNSMPQGDRVWNELEAIATLLGEDIADSRKKPPKFGHQRAMPWWRDW